MLSKVLPHGSVSLPTSAHSLLFWDMEKEEDKGNTPSMPMSSQQFSIHIPFRLFVDTQWIKGLTAKPDDLSSTTPNPQSRNQEPTPRSLTSQTCTHKHIGNVKMKEADTIKMDWTFYLTVGYFFFQS